MSDVGVDLPAIRDALHTLLDPSLPWVHEDGNHNCGECWECIAGTLMIARIFRREGLGWTAEDRGHEAARAMVDSKVVEYQSRALAAEAEAERLRGLVADLREAAQAVLAAGERVDELVHHGDDADYTRAVEKRDECEDELRRALAAGEATS